VGGALILETTFLIDLEREHQRGKAGPAIAFLELNPEARLYLPFVVAGELAAGVSMRDRTRWESFVAPLYVLPSTPDVSWHYGRAARHLHDTGATIGANDLWIAATGLAYGMPVVTRNAKHFRRVPELEVVDYSNADPAAHQDRLTTAGTSGWRVSGSSRPRRRGRTRCSPRERARRPPAAAAG
jgi:predicted nucleic acid-binding protein